MNLDERDANILRDARAKLHTIADNYEIAPEKVLRVLLNQHKGARRWREEAKRKAEALAAGSSE